MIEEKIANDESRLDNAEKQLKFHIDKKSKLIKQLKDTNEYKLRIKLKEKINEQKTMIEIWINDINSIKSRVKK
ncbi:hypothetical protein [Nitrosopumilus maritimus]|uniref:hypothetical protein n=1 Tax=Nitrosopumilus maritimus TaxID=338192 RepID=UPI000159B3BF|nr:hypothetical protein [Nitrosopumilus maritimus]